VVCVYRWEYGVCISVGVGARLSCKICMTFSKQKFAFFRVSPKCYLREGAELLQIDGVTVCYSLRTCFHQCFVWDPSLADFRH